MKTLTAAEFRRMYRTMDEMDAAERSDDNG